MIRVVDRADNLVVQKVIHPKGHVIRYQVAVLKECGAVASVAGEFANLTKARAYIGKVPKKQQAR
jgi:hypothetical protein